MTHPDSLTVLFQHNRWANLCILEACAKLSDAQLDATLIGTFGTIRETLTHIVVSERSYVHRISTGQPYPRPANPPVLTVTDMVELSRTTGSGLIEWATKVQAGDVVKIDWGGTLYDVPKTIVLTQAINHATEHRAQVMAILTQLGVAPPDVSGWSYFVDHA